MKKFVRTQTEARRKTLQQELRRAAKTPNDPESIHDVRVAIRRFVQCLRSFEQFFDPDEIKRVRKPLRKLMQRCGDVRNCDIAIALLREAGLAEAPAIAALEQQRREAEKTLVRKLKREQKMEPAKSALKIDVQDEGPWDAQRGVSENASIVLPGNAADIFKAGAAAAAPRASHNTMHQFRLRSKRFRYTLEIFQPVYVARKAKVKRALELMRGLQDRLGAINDCITARELVKGDRPAVAAINKVLPGREAEFRRYWKQRFGAASRKWWVDWLASPE